jgi:hypothetical protein
MVVPGLDPGTWQDDSNGRSLRMFDVLLLKAVP